MPLNKTYQRFDKEVEPDLTTTTADIFRKQAPSSRELTSELIAIQRLGRTRVKIRRARSFEPC